ncbi:hypothetical protein ZIOFF_036851 [Zingiber officinale]|uniref:DDE Tnp4 domain-containing protein n=1 Tax=Zingiber officinale TaxID=94328 RepID=A0A8J5GJ59_ZINOF|nr:hypothetical protein ZIOFF_036851 [Zingiber officinale]
MSKQLQKWRQRDEAKGRALYTVEDGIVKFRGSAAVFHAGNLFCFGKFSCCFSCWKSVFLWEDTGNPYPKQVEPGLEDIEKPSSTMVILEKAMFDAMSVDRGSDVKKDLSNARIKDSNCLYDPKIHDCVDALDGIHIRVKVSDVDAPRYRGRKDWPTTNMLVGCSFDLKFIYVLAGWEEIASDSRNIKNALSRRDKLIIPHGKYYLVDSGFMLKRDLITPYREIHYHLKEYSRCGPTNAKELFSLRHESLRGAISFWGFKEEISNYY